MRRTLSILAYVLVAFLVGVFVAERSVVRAGRTAGLVGRTHLIVKEHNLKRFTTGSIAPSPTLSSHSCFEVSRTGVVSPTPYAVPAGKVLVITDVQVGASPSTGAWLDSASSVLSWAFGTGASPSPSTHLTSGLVLDPGSPLAFLSFTTSGAPYAIHVLGYETVDVP